MRNPVRASPRSESSTIGACRSVLDEQRVDALGRTHAFGADDHAIAGIEHLLDLRDEARTVTDYRVEARRGHARRIGAVRCVGHGEHRRVTTSQQSFEANVQPRQPLVAIAYFDIPSASE